MTNILASMCPYDKPLYINMYMYGGMHVYNSIGRRQVPVHVHVCTYVGSCGASLMFVVKLDQ